MSDRFSADIERLRTGAKELLGATTDDLGEANGFVRRTAADDDAFDNIDGGRSLFRGVGDAWDNTRGYMIRVFDDNTENLRLAQQALLEIADRYEEADRGSAAALNRVEGLR